MFIGVTFCSLSHGDQTPSSHGAGAAGSDHHDRVRGYWRPDADHRLEAQLGPRRQTSQGQYHRHCFTRILFPFDNTVGQSDK